MDDVLVFDFIDGRVETRRFATEPRVEVETASLGAPPPRG